MKKELIAGILAGVILCLGINTYADELTPLNETPTQVIEIEKSGAVAILQKQPTNENQKQVIKIKKAGGFLLIQINGKIKDSDISLQNRK